MKDEFTIGMAIVFFPIILILFGGMALFFDDSEYSGFSKNAGWYFLAIVVLVCIGGILHHLGI